MDVLKIKKLYAEIAAYTKPKCTNACRVPQSCCSPEYCDMAIEIAAKEYNIILEKTNHPKLPLMGENGCVAEPYLRPLCSLHVCEGTLMRSGQDYLEKYFDIRDKINMEEAKKYLNKSQLESFN